MTVATAENRALLGLGCCTAEEALGTVGAERSGLAEEEVERRREKFGINEVAHERRPAWYVQLFHAFATPFTCGRSSSSAR